MMTPQPLTFGETRRRVDSAGLSLVESHYTPHLRIATHEHERPVLVLVLKGGFRATSAVGTETFGQDSIRTVPAGERHSNDYGLAPTRCFLVGIGDAPAARLGEHAAILQQPMHHAPDGRAVDCMRRMHAELTTSDPSSVLAIEGLFLELIAALTRIAPSRLGTPPAWLRNARERIHATFREDVSIAAIGADVGVHPVHLARLFRAHFGCTPSKYVRRLRINWATRALVETNAPISSIALDAGFADQSHFTRAFRRAMDATPACYREIMQD